MESMRKNKLKNQNSVIVAQPAALVEALDFNVSENYITKIEKHLQISSVYNGTHMTQCTMTRQFRNADQKNPESPSIRHPETTK